MNRLLTVALALAMAVSTFAATPKTYDLTGQITFSSYHSDSEAHLTVDGKTYSSYCSTSGSSVDCTDHPGIFELKLADGSKYTFFREPGFPNQNDGIIDPILDSPKVARITYQPNVDAAKAKMDTAWKAAEITPHVAGDPAYGAYEAARMDYIRVTAAQQAQPGTFAYRMTKEHGMSGDPVICVPFTDSKGKQKEACYVVIKEQ